MFPKSFALENVLMDLISKEYYWYFIKKNLIYLMVLKKLDPSKNH